MLTTQDLIEKIQSDDANVRGDAWQGAGAAGPDVLPELAGLSSHDDFEVARAARRAMWRIVRHVGRPGADAERGPTVEKLRAMLMSESAVPIRRELLWMLSELASDGGTLATFVQLLDDEELREDARCAIERMPGDAAVAVLRKALEGASDAFAPAIAQSLRARGVEVPGIPCRKLVPTRATQVKTPGA